MRVNQNSEPVEEVRMFAGWTEPATDNERDQAINLILQHLNCHIVRTNATKHGSIELELRADGDAS